MELEDIAFELVLVVTNPHRNHVDLVDATMVWLDTAQQAGFSPTVVAAPPGLLRDHTDNANGCVYVIGLATCDGARYFIIMSEWNPALPVVTITSRRCTAQDEHLAESLKLVLP